MTAVARLRADLRMLRREVEPVQPPARRAVAGADQGAGQPALTRRLCTRLDGLRDVDDRRVREHGPRPRVRCPGW